MPIDTNKLISLRKNAGMSQTELGKVSGLCEQTISNIETGRTIPTLLTTQKLAKALKVTLVDYILIDIA